MQGTTDARDNLGYHPSLVENKIPYTRAYLTQRFHFGRTFGLEKVTSGEKAFRQLVLKNNQPSPRTPTFGLLYDLIADVLTRIPS